MNFCENCRDEVEYYTKEEMSSRNIHDKEVSYKVKLAFCKTCDGEIYIPEINDENLKSLEDAYEKSK